MQLIQLLLQEHLIAPNLVGFVQRRNDHRFEMVGLQVPYGQQGTLRRTCARSSKKRAKAAGKGTPQACLNVKDNTFVKGTLFPLSH